MRPPERTRVRVSPGAPALLAVFVWLSSPEVLGAVLLAALCHELGHYAVLRSRGGWVRYMEISALGANMQVAGRLSYGSELLAAAGGPAVNLLLLAVDTALMLTSSAYGIRAAVSGVREGRLSIGRAVLLGVLHLFFVFDVIGASVEYAFFRAADSKNKLQQEGIHS